MSPRALPRERDEHAEHGRADLLDAALSVPNTVACTVSSAAHGARNACAMSNTWSASTQAMTAARTVLNICGAFDHKRGVAQKRSRMSLSSTRAMLAGVLLDHSLALVEGGWRICGRR